MKSSLALINNIRKKDQPKRNELIYGSLQKVNRMYILSVVVLYKVMLYGRLRFHTAAKYTQSVIRLRLSLNIIPIRWFFGVWIICAMSVT